MKNRSAASSLRVFVASALAALGVALPAHAVDLVGQTSARFQWSAASGPVAGYAVYVARNGGAFPTTPTQMVSSTQATVTGAYGDSVAIRVAAHDGAMSYGPASPDSETVRFVAATPALVLSTGSLAGTVEQGGSAPLLSFTVRNGSSGTLDYSISKSASWIALSPTSGSSTGESDSIGVSLGSAGLAPGTYSGSITVSAPGAQNSPQAIAVTLTVTAAPTPPPPPPPPAVPSLGLTTSGIAGSADEGGGAVSTGFGVRNAASGTLSYAISTSAAWLSVTPASGTSTGETDAISVRMDPSGLAAGTHSGSVTVSAAGASNAPQTIAVSFSVKAKAPSLSLSTTTLAASAEEGAGAASSGFSVRNAGGGTLSFTVASSTPWLSVSPASGTSSGEFRNVAVSLNPAGLSSGTHQGTLTVSAPGVSNAPQTVNVTLTVQGKPPSLELSTSSIAVSVEEGGASATQTLSVRNAGGGVLSYALASNGSWLRVSPASGTSTGESDIVTLTLDPQGVAPGRYNGSLVVSAPGAANAPKTVPVTFTVTAKPAVLSVSPPALDFTVKQGAAKVASSVSVRNAGGGLLSYSLGKDVPWLALGRTSGGSRGETDEIPVTLNPAGLAVGRHEARITVSASGGAKDAPQTIPVSLTVEGEPPPTLSLTTGSLSATVEQGQSPTSAPSLVVCNVGGGTLNYAISSDSPWLTANPAGGTSTGEEDTITMALGTSALPPGTYRGRVTVSAPGAQDAPQTAEITLTVTPSGSSEDPKARRGVPLDFDGDGKSDLLWRRGESGRVVVWLMNTERRIAQGELPVMLEDSLTVAGSADFDGDGKADLLLRNGASGVNVLALLDGVNVVGGAPFPDLEPGWEVAAVADFDGDQKADVYWHHAQSGAQRLWLLDGLVLREDLPVAPLDSPEWKLAAAADFDGDGKADTFWRRQSDGGNLVRLMNGASIVASAWARTYPDPRWSVVAAGDFDRDGKADLLWRHSSMGYNYVWIMNGTATTYRTYLPTLSGYGWVLGAAGDFDGDGSLDLFWRNSGGTTNSLWVMNGLSVRAQRTADAVPDASWATVGR